MRFGEWKNVFGSPRSIFCVSGGVQISRKRKSEDAETTLLDSEVMHLLRVDLPSEYQSQRILVQTENAVGEARYLSAHRSSLNH